MSDGSSVDSGITPSDPLMLATVFGQPAPELPTPLVVGPNDYLVVNLGPNASMRQVEVARAQLIGEWGDTRVLIISAQEVVVLRSDSPIVVDRMGG